MPRCSFVRKYTGTFATTPEELGKQGFDFSTLTSVKKFVLELVGGQDTGLA